MKSEWNRIYYGWVVVGASFVTVLLTTGIGFYTFSVFMIPLETTFGASRAAITGLNSMTALVAGVATPLIGVLVHRWGPGKVVGLGAVLTGGAYLLLSRSTEVWHLYALGFLLGTGLSATTLIPNQTLVSNWFARKRGTAMGVMMIGIALGGIVFAPLAHDLIEVFHWRGAYVIFGIVIPTVIVPLAVFVIRRSPESIGLLPDGDAQKLEENVSIHGEERGFSGLTVSEAARTASFWHLFIVQFFVTMGLSIVTGHVVAIVTASPFGVARGREAAMAMGSLTIRDFLIVSVPGRFLAGYLAERLSKRYVLVGQYLILVAAALSLLRLENSVMLHVFVLLFGLGLGCVVVYPLLVAENFGLLSFSKILGIMGIPFTLGAAIGQVLAARMYDSTNSYAGVFILLAGVFAIGSALVILAKPPRPAESSG